MTKRNLAKLINNRPEQKLLNASSKGDLETVKAVFDAAVKVDKYHGDCALCNSVERGHLEVVKYLVERGVDIHQDDDYALSLAVTHRHLGIVKFLVENGANIHNNDDEALWTLEASLAPELVEYVIGLYDWESRDENGQTRYERIRDDEKFFNIIEKVEDFLAREAKVKAEKIAAERAAQAAEELKCQTEEQKIHAERVAILKATAKPLKIKRKM